MVEELESIALPLVNRFYRENGHKGKARSDERVFVLRDQGRIVAALRACPKADGYLLRSVWVATDRRRKGTGTTLLNCVLSKLGSFPCWCYPFDYLEAFYQRSGLQQVPPEQTPDEISSVWVNYRARGERFLLMGTVSGLEDSSPG